jgi:predicted phage-related endonuclease
MLSPERIALRQDTLGSSDVGILMAGDEQAIHNLWLEKSGAPNYVREDISDRWPVILGACTETINLDRYEHNTGRAVTRRGEHVVHLDYTWATCTLDGYDAALPAVVEAKHVGGFEKISVVVERYMAQLHWQMLLTGTKQAALSVIEGEREPIIELIDYDEPYGSELFNRAQQFWRCVLDLVPPVVLPPVAPPVVPDKIVDMTGNNSFANEAATWLATKEAAAENAAAGKALRAMVPDDALKCVGHGVCISRNRAGALSIREVKE